MAWNIDAEEQRYEDEEQAKYIREYMEKKRRRKHRREFLVKQTLFYLKMAGGCFIMIFKKEG